MHPLDSPILTQCFLSETESLSWQYRSRKFNNELLVKLPPGMPPVNLLSSVRVMSHSPFLLVSSYVCLQLGWTHLWLSSPERFLNLSNVALTGIIPRELGNLTFLVSLDLGSNKFHGNLPQEMAHLHRLKLGWIDSQNNGQIEKPSALQLEQQQITGFIGDHICKLQHLGDIYLGQNQLSGSLPNFLGNITSFREIHFGSNKLSSNKPPRFGNLQDVVFLDLSSNNMVGSLPPEIGNIKAAILSFEKHQNLMYFNVSVNKLYGEIPSGGPFKNLSSQFFIYNEALCGSSRFSVPPCPTSSNRKKLLVPSLLLAMAVVFVPMTFVLLWIRYRRGKRAPQQADSLATKKRERISYNELLQATDDLSESNLIGSGGFGSVYKGFVKS
ncbi:hypothetical protein BC332_09979 [Capsicum chinense]|nr:hypothetical protein BC332_09979 [Capsicum chinense]